MEIGITLKNARESQDISLDAAEESTKIRKKYLQALEQENFDILPGKVYVRGFLRNYARFLGIDGEDLVNQYNSYLESMEQGPEEEEELPGASNTNFFQDNSKTLLGLLGLLLVIALIIMFSGVLGGTGKNENNSSSKEGEQVEQVQNGNSSTGGAEGEPEEGTNDNPAPAVTENDEVTVTLEITGTECWMSVVIDNTKKMQLSMQKGEKRQFTGKESVYIRLGNAGAVKVSVNGESKGYLGETGDVEEKTYYAGDSAPE